jgi:hypothetical protein
MDTSIPELYVNGERKSPEDFGKALECLRDGPLLHRKDHALPNAKSCPASLVYGKGEVTFIDGRKEIVLAR